MRNPPPPTAPLRNPPEGYACVSLVVRHKPKRVQKPRTSYPRVRTATMSDSNNSVPFLHKYLSQFVTILTTIPGNPGAPDSGTQLVKTFAEAIARKLGDKGPEQLVAEHATERVFEPGQEPSAMTIMLSWWNETPRPSSLVRILFPLGPANKVTPAGFQRANQGILCQPSAETGYRPTCLPRPRFCRPLEMSDGKIMLAPHATHKGGVANWVCRPRDFESMLMLCIA